MAGTSKTDSEGIDFSNYSLPGALTLIFPEDENSGRGTRDLMLTKSESTFTLLAGDNMSFDLQNESGIHSLLGQSLTTRISGFSEEDITICSSGCTITPGTYGGLDDKLVILKVSASEYWLLELRFLDTNFGFWILVLQRSLLRDGLNFLMRDLKKVQLMWQKQVSYNIPISCLEMAIN